MSIPRMSRHLQLLFLFLILSLVGLFAVYAWNSQYNILNPNVSFVTGKSRNVLSFTNLFIKDVLQSNGQVSLATQTQLEDKLRALNDPTLNAAWEKLITANNETDLQQQTSAFLLLLIEKAQGES